MTPANLTTLIRRKTRTTDVTYTDAELLVDINNAIEEIAGHIQTMRPEVFNVPSKFDLVANRREYAFPVDVLNSITSLDLKFGASEDYVRATSLKRTPEELVEANIQSDYGSQPHYFIRRKAIYILSKEVPTLADGGLIVFNAFPATLTDLTLTTDLSIDPSTTTHGFPREFHNLLATKTSMHYKDVNSMALNREEQNYENDLEKKLGEFSVVDQSMEELIVTPSSASLEDNGYDY